MIKNSLWFEYDNENSSDYGIINCNLSTGLIEEPFVAQSEIVETEIRGKDKPYFQEIKQKPLEFDVNFAFENEWTEKSLQRVKRWLRKPYYCKLRFSERPDKIYYGIFVGEPILNHNGSNQGYFTWHFRCNSPYVYSPVYTDYYDFSESDVGYFEFNNLGDVNVLPIIEIKKIEKGKISIFNLSDSNKEFGFDTLEDDEIVEVNCKRQNIVSNLSTSPPLIYRYDNLINNYYMSLPYGVNRLKVEGKCFLTLKYEYKFF